MAALKIADYDARQNDEKEISKARIHSLWTGLLNIGKPTSSLDANRDKSLVKQVVAQKVAAYDKYNKVSSPLFI